MKIRFCLSLLVLTTLLIPAFAFAQSQSAVTLSVEAGFDGYYKVGQWLPVYVILENNGPNMDGRVEVTLPRVGGGKVTYAYPVSLPTQSRKEITLPLRPEEYINRIKLALFDNAGQVIAQQEQPLKVLGDTDRLLGVIADQPSVFNVLGEINPPGATLRLAQLTAHRLPDRAATFGMLDTLVLSNVDTGALTEAQRAALSTWIASGGRLIITGGPGWQKTSAGLHNLLPLQPESTTTLDDLSALKSFASYTVDPGGTIIATGSLAPDAQVILDQAGQPLIVRRQYGSGEVYFLSFDPAALKQWDGMAQVYRQLITTVRDKPGWSYGVQNWYSASMAASTIPNLNLPPVSLICAFLGIYMLAIGPVNYFIVRALKRRELAWISAPLLAIGFMAMAFLVGSSQRGTQPVLNRLALVQVWPTASRAYLTGIVGLYAPQRAAYQLKADQGLLLYPATSDPNSYQSTNDTSDWLISSDADTLRARVEMDVSEVKTLSAEGEVAAPQIESAVQVIVDSTGARATGTVTNRSDLTLQDAVLLGPGLAHEVGTVQPGASLPINFNLERASYSSRANSDAPDYYGNNGDSTWGDILGHSYFDDEGGIQTRRNALLKALFDTNNASHWGRGNGLYLVGWSERSPMNASVEGTAFGAYDTTLYVIDLSPALKVVPGTLALPPGVFTWWAENLEGHPPISPYNVTATGVPPGTYTYILQFNLAQPIAYETVQGLTLHLTSGAVISTQVTVSLWNYRLKDWTPLPNVQSGENVIPDPAQYVGLGGEIRLKLVFSGSFDLERADFTLTVQ